VLVGIIAHSKRKKVRRKAKTVQGGGKGKRTARLWGKYVGSCPYSVKTENRKGDETYDKARAAGSEKLFTRASVVGGRAGAKKKGGETREKGQGEGVRGGGGKMS